MYIHTTHTSVYAYAQTCARVCVCIVYLEISVLNGRKEGNVLFNDTLNTLYLWLYGVSHMVEDHSDSERGNPLPPHGLLFLISSKGSLYASSHRQDNTYHSICYTSRGALACFECIITENINFFLFHLEINCMS